MKKSKTNIQLKQELENALTTLMTSDTQVVKAAKQKIENLWHKSPRKAFLKHAPIALDYLDRFDSIEQPSNQAAFASGLNIFFLVLADDHFEVLQDFTLKVIQHPHGHVREAIRKTADWLYISLSDRIHPFVYPKNKPLTPKQKSEQAQATKQYRDYIREIKDLIERYRSGNESTIEYIDKLKPSVHKSLQMLLSDLTRGSLSATLHTPPPEILAKRGEIEQELQELLKDRGSDFDLSDIKDIIYNEEGPDDLMRIVAMFDTGQSMHQLQYILDVANNAWNYFPHRILDGLSPSEMILKHQNKSQP